MSMIMEKATGITKETKALIESVIKESPKYKGNEELLDIFSDAIYKKSYLLIDAIKDKSRLRRHLITICDSTISQILKEKKRFDETKLFTEIQRKAALRNSQQNKRSYTGDVRPVQDKQQAPYSGEIVNIKEEVIKKERIDSVASLIDPIELFPLRKVSQKALRMLIKAVKSADMRFPKRQYYEIFKLRYMQGLDQMEIASALEISQAELSKRFVELIRVVMKNV